MMYRFSMGQVFLFWWLCIGGILGCDIGTGVWPSPVWRILVLPCVVVALGFAGIWAVRTWRGERL